MEISQAEVGTPRLQDWRSMHAMRPLWSDLHDAPRFGQLQSDELEVDVAIVGGGVTGLTAVAWLLKKAGRRVAVLEAREELERVLAAAVASRPRWTRAATCCRWRRR